MAVTIAAVRPSALDSQHLRGGSIDVPRNGDVNEDDQLEIHGWVLSAEQPVAAVELCHGGLVIRRLKLDVRRPDVAAAHPELANAELSGFATCLRLRGVAGPLELQIRAVLADRRRLPLAALSVQVGAE